MEPGMVPELNHEQRIRLTEMLASELLAAHTAALAAGADPHRLAALIARRRSDVRALIAPRV